MLKRFLSELRRRRVFQTLLPYLGVVWLLLQVASVLQPMLHFSQTASAIFGLILLFSIPLVAYLSWYYDFGLDGIRQVEESDGTIRPLRLRHWLWLMMIIGLSGVVGFQYYQSLQSSINKQAEGLSKQLTARSIAVLSFRDVSQNQEQLYLAQGMSETLSQMLGQEPALKVLSSSSVFALQQQSLLPVDIAHRLQADILLNGNVRLTGSKLRVYAELLDPISSKVLWSDTFDRQLNDVFQVQEDIARSVLNLLQDQYLAPGSLQASQKTAASDAYLLYLQGRAAYRKQTAADMQVARDLFRQAIAMDPEYALAYAAEADSVVMLADTPNTFGVLQPDVALRLANEKLDAALLRAPELAEAHAVRGHTMWLLSNDPLAAIDALNKAIELNPSLANAYMWRFQAQNQLGHYADALVSLQQAHELDPVSIATSYNLGWELMVRGQLDEATRQFEQLSKDFPDSPMGIEGLANVALMRGDLAQSAVYRQRIWQQSPQNPQFRDNYLIILYSLGLTELAQQVSDEPSWQSSNLLIEGKYRDFIAEQEFNLAANPGEPWVQFEAAWYHSLVGERARAVQLLTELNGQFTDAEQYAMPMCSPALEIAWAFQQRQDNKAAQIISQCKQQVKEAKTSGKVDSFVDYTAARIAALQGDKPTMITELNSALKHGWREWWTKMDPLLAPYLSDPEITDMMAFLDRELAHQKQLAITLLTPEHPATQGKE
ncbi:tetratricopeptide repeat protein [Bowmanella sp. JS7-9]|uniref:Tetratricopeptide repeat protein n=1 Tax=Pseudobowmanella zhangzhouensis TaxID=1537679 RepID=A0ABW1XFX3_9ALTE|nr:tetratricopeptide repeat protein [Bowmanella sp. JS7-9]